MFLTSADRPIRLSASRTPARGYRRVRPLLGAHLDLMPPVAACAGHLQVQVTLGGNTYTQRHQAKAAGYRWAHGQWHHLLRVAVRLDSAPSRAAGDARLRALITAATAPFARWSAGDVVYRPALIPPQADGPDGVWAVPPAATGLASRVPIRLVTSLDALLTVVGQGSLIVLDPPPTASGGGRTEARTHWCAAEAERDSRVRYLLQSRVLRDAQTVGELRTDPVWRAGGAGGRWCPLYPMTSRWLEAEGAGQLILGQRLTLP